MLLLREVPLHVLVPLTHRVTYPPIFSRINFLNLAMSDVDALEMAVLVDDTLLHRIDATVVIENVWAKIGIGARIPDAQSVCCKPSC
jgi:hypothetical protein